MKNLRRLAGKFDLDQSERKSSQVNASARKAWPNGVAIRNLRLLASPFDQGFTLLIAYGVKLLKADWLRERESIFPKPLGHF